MSNPLSNGSYSRYRVINLQGVDEALKDLMARASAQGVGDVVLKAIKANVARLHVAPLSFGEPRYTLAELHLEVRVGAFRGLVVQFSVDESNRIVYVRKVIPMRGLGLK